MADDQEKAKKEQLVTYARDLASVYRESRKQQTELDAFREKEKYRQYLEAVFDNVKDAIVTVDPDLIVTGANRATAEVCGFEPRNIIDRPITDGELSLCRCLQTLVDTIRSGKSIRDFRVECGDLCRQGQVTVLSSSLLKDANDQLLGALLVVRDVTRITTLERRLRERNHFHNLIGKSGGMQDVYALLETLAGTDTTVLIRGESGTGKELVARALHYRGVRASGPMVTVNCSALAEDLLESELFGHIRGSFTGAIRDRTGRFQEADGGTIFLDEIGDISPRTQLKLLRFLQEREFERVGDSRAIKVDVRVVTATHRNLEQLVETGAFRSDLYYRLKVVEVRLPALRERHEDLPLLVEHFRTIFNKKLNRNIEGVTDEVTEVFMNYDWPGNVRELEHALEHAFILCKEDTISTHHLPRELLGDARLHSPQRPASAADGGVSIRSALEKTGWNKAKAAKLLGVSRPTLYKKMAEYGIVEAPD